MEPMSSTAYPPFTLGSTIEIQYEVFKPSLAPEIQWYEGFVTGLTLLDKSRSQVTVRFEGCDSFPDSDESFLFSNNKLTRQGKEFPFNLSNASQTHYNPGKDCDKYVKQGTSENSTELLVRLDNMECRLKSLELQCAEPLIPGLFMSVCALLNRSLTKFKSTKHKFQPGSNDIISSNVRLSQSSSYNEFKQLLAYLRTLSSDLTIDGDDETTTASVRITIYVHSFKTFCTLFSISDYNYTSLLSCPHYNRKGEIASFKCIGSLIDNRSEPSLPTLLCIGGCPRQWNANNRFFYKENSHTLNSGIAACAYERVTSSEGHNAVVSRLAPVEDNSISIEWTMDDSRDLCRPLPLRSSFTGKVDVVLPQLSFNNRQVATKINKWLSPNRRASFSSQHSDSSSD